MSLRNPAPIRFAVLSCRSLSVAALPEVAVHSEMSLRPEIAARVDAYRSVDGFRNQWGLEHVKADVAYSHLELLQGPEAEPGAGVTLGFVDTGIDPDHPMFAGKNVTEEFTPGAVDETGIDDVSHGTAVASIAAGAGLTDSRAPHGLAWGADVVMFGLTLGSGDGTYRPVRVAGLAGDDAEDAALCTQALSWRDGSRKVDILNLPSFPRKRESRWGGAGAMEPLHHHPWIPACAGMTEWGANDGGRTSYHEVAVR